MASQNYTDSELFNRLAADDEKAFKTIFERYWPQVYGTTVRLTKNSGQACDLAQDIFVKLWENRSKLEHIANPSSYLFILSRNLVMDHLRKKVFESSNIEFLYDYFQKTDTSPSERAEYRELEGLLERAVNTLSGKVKDVFLLSRKEGLTHEQIAQRLGISIVSSKTYVVRALQQIRKFMETHSDESLLLIFVTLLSLNNL